MNYVSVKLVLCLQNGQTFLMVACQQGEISLARELLDAGIDPNATDNVSGTNVIDIFRYGSVEEFFIWS